jgi:SAM-dependent methyltransferase
MCREEGFAWDVEAIAVARMIGIRVQEVGIEWRHQEGSRVNVLGDGARMVRAVPRIRRNLISGARSRPHAAGDLASTNTQDWRVRSKATLVSLLLRHSAPTDGWLVEIGSGPSAVAAMLAWAPNRILALEANLELARATSSHAAVIPVACDATQLPLAESTASVVCLLDHAQHLLDPIPAIREAARILTPEGRMVVSVSTHPRSHGPVKESVRHTRPYTRNALREDLESVGCEVLWISHVFSWVAFPMWLGRRTKPANRPHRVGTPFLDALSMFLTRIEWFTISRVPLPVGTSVLCVAARAEIRQSSGARLR